MRGLILWGVLSAVGSAIYLALFLLGAPVPTWYRAIPAIVLFAVAGTLLLAVDEAADTKLETSSMTFAGLLYIMLTARKSLLALLVLVLIGTGTSTYYIVSSLVHVERQTDAGLVIQLAGETVTFQPIHPYGWQPTGIHVKRGQRISVELWGSVSPGFIANYQKIDNYMKAYRQWTERPKEALRQPLPAKPLLEWPYSGPQGYAESYYRPGEHWVEDYRTANTLTVRGLRHNVVVGVILDKTEQPCRIYQASPTENLQTSFDLPEYRPCVAGYVTENGVAVSYPGYDWESDAKGEKRLLNLSTLAQSRGVYDVFREGDLWVTVNDSDDFRFDNTGFFFMKLTIRRW